jgi:hypothetical protein
MIKPRIQTKKRSQKTGFFQYSYLLNQYYTISSGLGTSIEGFSGTLG